MVDAALRCDIMLWIRLFTNGKCQFWSQNRAPIF